MKMSKEELEERTLHDLKEDIEGLIFHLNSLHPDFMGSEEAYKQLREWVPEQTNVAHFEESGYYEKGDEDAPFFSEAYLYNLLGKDDARTLLYLIQEAFGMRWQ